MSSVTSHDRRREERDEVLFVVLVRTLLFFQFFCRYIRSAYSIAIPCMYDIKHTYVVYALLCSPPCHTAPRLAKRSVGWHPASKQRRLELYWGPRLVFFGRTHSSLEAGTVRVMTSCCLVGKWTSCLLYTSPSPRDGLLSRMPSSA